jgi:hypothetical protein
MEHVAILARFYEARRLACLEALSEILARQQRGELTPSPGHIDCLRETIAAYDRVLTPSGLDRKAAAERPRATLSYA